MPTCATRSADWRGAVAARRTGRVWGAGAGNAPSPTTRRTPSCAAKRHHRVDERGPPEVRLGADQVTDVGADPVGAHPHLDDRPREPLVDPVGDVHHRTPGPLVDERLAVEGGDELGRVGRQQRGDGAVGAKPGVDPSLERHDQDGAVE